MSLFKYIYYRLLFSEENKLTGNCYNPLRDARNKKIDKAVECHLNKKKPTLLVCFTLFTPGKLTIFLWVLIFLIIFEKLGVKNTFLNTEKCIY